MLTAGTEGRASQAAASLIGRSPSGLYDGRAMLMRAGMADCGASSKTDHSVDGCAYALDTKSCPASVFN
ncbi:hypothetical protein ASF73_04730 [Xanthomonas sp. Leaf131]|nr:hypothetical protein ASF73_04730 [Xanthomonas sp. Leaf131]